MPINQTVVANFSAVCWYFGKELTQLLNIPIGLIQSTFAGTTIDKWIREEEYKKCLKTASKDLDLLKQYGFPKGKPSTHSRKWPVLIHPLTSMSIRGLVVYQGESDCYFEPHLFGCNFLALINDYRRQWFVRTNGSTSPRLPFGFVQLQSFHDFTETDRIGPNPWVRFHQTYDYGFCPNPAMDNVFMASAIDLDDFNVSDTSNAKYESVHSKRKEEVGKRLSLGALNLVYNVSVEYAAPRVFLIEYTSSNITIEFVSQTGQPFEISVLHDRGFEVCCDSDACFQDPNQNWKPLFGIKISNLNYSSLATFKKPAYCQKPMFVRYLMRVHTCELYSCPLYSAKSQLPITPFIHRINQKSSLIPKKEHMQTVEVYHVLVESNTLYRLSTENMIFLILIIVFGFLFMKNKIRKLVDISSKKS